MTITLSSIPRKSGTTFSAQFRVTDIRRRVDRFGRPFQSMKLVDITGQLPAYRWMCERSWRLDEMEAVSLKGRIREFNGEWIADILEITPLWTYIDAPENGIQLLPWTHCRKRDVLPRLQAIEDGICSAAMRGFLNSVFYDMEVIQGLIRGAASRDHHHHWPGGLLEHSIECAEWVAWIAGSPSWRRDIAVVGALLHDIGKIQACPLAATGAPDAFLIHHDARILELLAPHLRQFQRQWPDGAAALRYIWTWQHSYRRPQYPALIEAEIVRFADRLSAMGDIQRLAFRDAEEWQRFCKFGTYDKNGRAHSPVQTCWRPRLPIDV